MVSTFGLVSATSKRFAGANTGKDMHYMPIFYSITILKPALMNATTSFSFKSERARKVLGYSPVISTEGCLKVRQRFQIFTCSDNDQI